MFRYYLALGFRSLRRNPVLTLLMVLTLSVGVAASMTTLTILRAMSGDPIPHKSERLFVPLINNLPADDGGSDFPDQLSHGDAMRLWEAARGLRQTPLYGLSPAIDSGRSDLPPFFSDGVAVGRDFFGLFDVPFLHGQAWSAEDDRRGLPVVVISRSLAERLFGADVNPVGQRVRISDADYAISGVIDRWSPLPKFYRLVGTNQFGGSEDVFLPFRNAIDRELGADGNISCSGPPSAPGFKGQVDSECNWVQFWVELESAEQRRAYTDFLASYVAEQKSLGRLPQPQSHRLLDLREWLDFNAVVSDDSRTATWLSFAFLLVCLVNAAGLLLAKFSSRPGEIGVRRALGATRAEIFRQYLTEAAVLGLVGAASGTALTWAALAFVRDFDNNLDLIARLDVGMATLALLLSIAASLLAGLLPTWRACQVTPALQLKSQ